MKKLILTTFLVVSLFFGLGAVSHAQLITLTDMNSTAQIDTGSSAGMRSWNVDNVSQLYQQWFWYSVGSGPVQSIDTLRAISVDTSGNTAVLTYQGGDFTIAISYMLLGGTAGSGTADIAETIRIVNSGTSSLDFHFFQYSDFDLNGTPDNDTVTLSNNGNKVTQTDANGGAISETIANPTANHYELSYYSYLLNNLPGGSAMSLSDGATSLGPGDVTWAFEWDPTIAAGGSYLISKDKQISATPIPAAAWLLGSGLFGLIGIRRRIA